MTRAITGDVSGALADLGILVPLTAALVVVNGLDVGSVLLLAGLLVVSAGLVFRIPFPVQPLKALTALAVAQRLGPDVIHAAGLEIGIVLMLMSLTGLATLMSKLFTKPVVRALQFGVGWLLVVTAVKLVVNPPAVFVNSPSSRTGLLLAAATVVVVVIAAWRRWYLLSIALVVAGVIATLLVEQPSFGGPSIDLPTFSIPPWSVFGTAFVLLVIPQIPLTYGNAVVGVSDLAREQFGERARRVSPARVALVCGLGNVASATFGGMPMCHGSSGLSAHVRMGAQTWKMNAMLGGTLITLGVFFSDQVLEMFGLLPVWVLGGFLAYAGIRHAMLVLDLEPIQIALAIAAAAVGIWTSNLAYTTAIALVIAQAPLVYNRIRNGRHKDAASL
ncbi:MAG: putative sulfate/molybdate transporter [Actinobacteria bacterium]|nr:putative sulfate/molybdate transporter [Actinomycetota bacterium]